MSPTMPRDSIEGRMYNDLRNLAKRNGRDPAEYFTVYALEGFLVRLAQSETGENLVLKGGALMAAYSDRRPTRDIDFSASGFSDDIESCVSLVRSIVAIEHEDGLSFDLEGITAETIRDESDYPGTRIHVSSKLASAKLRFHVDMNFGDPIRPRPTTTALPLLLGGKVEVLAYPLAMILAEKIVTTIDRGTANTRWRDFLDVARIAESQEVKGSDLIVALETVSIYRKVELRPMKRVLDGMAENSQTKWLIWRKKQQLENDSPENFSVLLSDIICFADPAIVGEVKDKRWVPATRIWR